MRTFSWVRPSDGDEAALLVGWPREWLWLMVFGSLATVDRDVQPVATRAVISIVNLLWQTGGGDSNAHLSNAAGLPSYCR